jgi:hypothetical protein
MASAMLKAPTIASVIPISYRELQHLFAMNRLISLGSAKITSARSPLMAPKALNDYALRSNSGSLAMFAAIRQPHPDCYLQRTLIKISL